MLGCREIHEAMLGCRKEKRLVMIMPVILSGLLGLLDLGSEQCLKRGERGAHSRLQGEKHAGTHQALLRGNLV